MTSPMMTFDDLRLNRSPQLRSPLPAFNPLLSPLLAPLHKSRHEIQIQKTGQGWCLKDPGQDQTIVLSSEEEARIWLDQRYS
jgi:hypothetical protein